MLAYSEILQDIPPEHRLPFAVFCCKQENIDPYEGLAFFRFEAVQWFTEWIKQGDKKTDGKC